tara:strand:+ start:2578 stop:3030 length:453 start_codon:yes stop_codon:yes gene_type:complete
MIVEYDTITKEIRAAHYGREYVASDWSSYSISGQAIANCPDEENIAGKYVVIAEDGITGSFTNLTYFDISVTKVAISANDTDYCDFSGIPEGTTVYIDNTASGTIDSDGTCRFKAIDIGTYVIKFWKQNYASSSFSITADDGYLYDNITG